MKEKDTKHPTPFERVNTPLPLNVVSGQCDYFSRLGGLPLILPSCGGDCWPHGAFGHPDGYLVSSSIFRLAKSRLSSLSCVWRFLTSNHPLIDWLIDWTLLERTYPFYRMHMALGPCPPSVAYLQQMQKSVCCSAAAFFLWAAEPDWLWCSESILVNAGRRAKRCRMLQYVCLPVVW
jgi:hypothetical protein